MIKIGYDKRKNVYRKSIGFVFKKGKKVQKFWALGPDKDKAEIIALRAMAEWANLKSLGSSVWTTAALSVVDELKAALYASSEKPSNQNSYIESKPVLKSETKAAISKPLTYYQAIEYYCYQVIPTLNISEQWKVNLTYRMESLKEALDDLPLNLIKSEHLMDIVSNYKKRPENKKTKKPISIDTATHLIRAAKRLFDYLDTIDVWTMPKKFDRIFMVNKSDFIITKTERMTLRKGIQTFTIDELAIIYKKASDQLKEWMIVALNIGATQKELSDMMRGECFLESNPPSIEKLRTKTSRRREVFGKWVLWKETADILHSKLSNEPNWQYKKENGVYYYKAKSWPEWKIYKHQDEDIYQITVKRLEAQRSKPKNDTDPVFGSIVYISKGNVRIDHVRCAWFRVLKECDGHVKPLSFKYLRKTGATMISDIAGKEVGKVYLAHSVTEMIDKHYVPENYKKLSEALMVMRQRLQPMFEKKATSSKSKKT